MQKEQIDYSNTLFYKIFCKDVSITDLYIGHTTNFVQRKSSHKQSCVNPKSANHKLKLYNVIRENGGWTNWQMDIIAYHHCKDHYDARTKEQEYFISYNATLNSIEPMPRPKCVNNQTLLNNTNDVKSNHQCDICNFSCFNTQDAFNLHLAQNKHIKAVSRLNRLSANVGDKLPKVAAKYWCDCCRYNTDKTSSYSKHLLTAKHQKKTQITDKSQLVVITNICCDNCNKVYKSRVGLWKHKRTCNLHANNIAEKIVTSNNDGILYSSKDNLIAELLKQNQEFKEIMIEQNKHMMELINQQAS